MVLSNTLTDYMYALLWNKTPFDSKTNQDKKQERSPQAKLYCAFLVSCRETDPYSHTLSDQKSEISKHTAE